MSDSIIKINAGGKIFETQISTLTKYPESMLAVMFNHTDEGMTPMAKTEDGYYFLDVNPLHFGEILDYLRYGEISADDPTLVKGIAKLANYFGLTDLAFELECDSDWVILDLAGQKQVRMSKRSLTRFRSTKLAKYFLGDKEGKIALSQWIKKETGNRYYIDTGRPWCWFEHVLRFLRQPRTYYVKSDSRTAFKKELQFYGFSYGTHYELDADYDFSWKEATES